MILDSIYIIFQIRLKMVVGTVSAPAAEIYSS